MGLNCVAELIKNGSVTFMNSLAITSVAFLGASAHFFVFIIIIILILITDSEAYS